MTIEIADRLIKLRKKYGYSQEELADKLGLSRQAVSKWERAEASPDTDNLICLAKLYGVSLDELLNTDDSVEKIVEEQVKPQQEEKKEGIHIVDDEGNEVHIKDHHIYLKDKDGNKVEKKKVLSKLEKVNIIISSVLGGVALITYILLGCLLHMWWNAWVVFFAPEIIASIVRCIQHKNANKFNMAFTACFVFFFVCMVAPGGLWHPMWVVFLAIPVYHSICGSINKVLGKKDEDDDDECECCKK
jgi:transcriptional regulator with XRE-family HTH domain